MQVSSAGLVNGVCKPFAKRFFNAFTDAILSVKKRFESGDERLASFNQVPQYSSLVEDCCALEAMFTEYAKQARQEKLINCKTFEGDEERTKQEREKVLRKFESELQRLINRARRLCWLAGITKPEDANRERALVALENLGKLPKKVTTRRRLREHYASSREGLLIAIIELEGEGFSHKTKNEYALSASRIFEWAKEHYVTDEQIVNPWKGIVKKRAIGEGKRRHKRDSFNYDDLIGIFSHEVFSQGKLGYSYITKKFCLYQYWIPLLALTAGLRGNEVAQLYRSDIVFRNGHYFIHINNSRVDQSIKNEHAERYVKVSEELIRLGFLQFIDLYTENERLFPELKHYSRDGYFKNAGEWFRKNFKHKVGDKQSFYSFRHSFIDELKNAGLSREKVHDLVGHSNQSIALDQYGSDAGYDELARNLELVDFSDVLRDVCPFIETKAYKTLKASR